MASSTFFRLITQKSSKSRYCTSLTILVSLKLLGSAELKVLKENSNEDIAELYERAQLVLLLTPPLSSSDTSSESDVTALPRSTQAVEAASRWGPRMHEQEFSPVDPSPSAVSSFYRIRANSEDVIVIRKGNNLTLLHQLLSLCVNDSYSHSDYFGTTPYPLIKTMSSLTSKLSLLAQKYHSSERVRGPRWLLKHFYRNSLIKKAV